MNDRTRWDESGRQQQGGWEGSRQQPRQQQNWSGQQGGWSEENRQGRSRYFDQNRWDDDQPQQRDWSSGASHRNERPWGGSSGTMQPSGRGWSAQHDSETTRNDWGSSERGGTDWRSRDQWRAPGSQSFASDYGMRDGDNYDDRFRHESFGRAGGASNPTYGRGYGPDYGNERGSSYDRDESEGRARSNRSYGSGYRGDVRDERTYGRENEDRGFLARAGDEIASWFGDEDAARRREQDYRGHGPSDYTRSDDRIREDVNDRLTDDPRVDARHVSVSVANGEVTLNGTVASREAKRRAEDCIDRISGVKHVQNNLRVQQTASSSHAGSFGAASVAGAGGMAGMGATAGTTGQAGTAGSSGSTSGVTGGSSGSSGGSTTGASGLGTSGSGSSASTGSSGTTVSGTARKDT